MRNLWKMAQFDQVPQLTKCVAASVTCAALRRILGWVIIITRTGEADLRHWLEKGAFTRPAIEFHVVSDRRAQYPLRCFSQ
jgi:hypothetical protein